MSKTIAPLLSFGASGQIAKTQVYASWKGRPYARRYVVPSNPNSVDQQEVRSTFAWLSMFAKFQPANSAAAFAAAAETRRLTRQNVIIQANLSPMFDETDLDLLLFSPGAYGGFPAASMILTPDDGEIVVALTPPTLPTGWSVASAHAVAIRQQDPHTGELWSMVAGDDPTAAYSIALSGLTNAQEYVVGGWFSYTRPSGPTAYGPSINDTATPNP